MRGIKRWPAWVMGSLIRLACIDRAHLIVELGFRCTSTDEVIIWQIARDYGQGIFREWYMYGQKLIMHGDEVARLAPLLKGDHKGP